MRFAFWPWQQQIGWKELDEDFIRFTLLHTRWFRIYLHRLNAPNAHKVCHDHPWWFWTLLLKGGYNEYHQGIWTWQCAGSLLYRPAEWQHNVVTRGVSWSLILTGPKFRKWGFTEECR